MNSFLETLKEQRWDDHRYYHHSRVNQCLHLVSAISFLCAYLLVFKYPAVAVLMAWLVGMTSRQIGHFFFEPRDYDEVNAASHEHKEEIKVGYNLRRKIVLMTIWFLSPLVLYVNPSLFGFFEPKATPGQFLNHVALVWLAIAIGGLLFRTIQLFFLQNVKAGLAWMTKIVTDPFHDVMLYHRAPLYLMRGELIDPMHHLRQYGEHDIKEGLLQQKET